VRIYAPITSPGEQGAVEADDRLRAFARIAIPAMGSYLPQ
jgi:hypothetical protein